MKRIVPGLLIAGGWLLLLLKGSTLLFCLVIIVVVFLAVHEYLNMIDERDIVLFERVLLAFFLTLPVICACLFPDIRWLPLSFIASFFGLTCYFLYRYKDIKECYNLFCRFVFGIIYIGGLGAHLVLLRFLPDGSSWLIIVSAVTASSDSAAYFVGKAIGKRKLCPNISPNKTIEGALGGLAGGIFAASVFALLLLSTVNWFFLIGSAIVLVIAGIIGDLTESIIKRGTGTKDSGNILAGHGGILDRVDSLLFAAPVLYYLLLVII